MARQRVVAAFTGSQDSVAVSWATRPGSFGLSLACKVSDGAGNVAVQFTGVTASGATVVPSARFTGSVAITIFDK